MLVISSLDLGSISDSIGDLIRLGLCSRLETQSNTIQSRFVHPDFVSYCPGRERYPSRASL